MMLELGYTYHFVRRPALTTGDGFLLISRHRGTHSLLSAGLSFNFVFGKRAEQYRTLRQNSKWKFGNRG
jgi:hypothetical protein